VASLRQEKHTSFEIIRINERRFDAVIAPNVKQDLFSLIERGNDKIGVDLSVIEFIDSVGLGVLVSALRKVSTGGSIVLWGLKPSVQSVFELTQLYKVFHVFKYEADAIAWMNGR
jgi:anti-sigma B factor antagonist